MQQIKGNRDGKNRRNESYQIPGYGKNISRRHALILFDQGKLAKFGLTTQTTARQRYIKDLADSSRKDNVNRT